MARKHESGHEPYSPVDAKLLQSLPSVFSTETDQDGNDVVSIEKSESNSRVIDERVSAREPLNKQLKFQVSNAELREIRRIIGQIGSDLETSLNWSHVARAMLIIFKHAEDEIVRQARRSEPLARPRNSDALGLAEFEMNIAQILLTGFKEVKGLE